MLGPTTSKHVRDGTYPLGNLGATASLSHPAGISTIPYASFLQIERYEYQEGLKKVAANQNDALGAQSRSGASRVLVGGLNMMMERYYSSDGRWSMDADAAAINTNENKRNGREYSSSGSYWTGGPLPVRQNYPGGDKEIYLPNGNTTTINELMKEKEGPLARRRDGLKASIVNLALPDEFQYSYSADWGNTFKMGTRALLADNFLKGGALAVAGGAIG